MDAIAEFKANQRVAWSGFAVLESMTGTTAPGLVRFAGVRAGQDVLDVACGTGVVALAAARTGARVTGLDLTPELIERARENATMCGLQASFGEADVEALPCEDATFDVVLSQFGHMFAPRPDVALAEMLRVLRPGGTIAFATWPPELFVSRMFALVGSYAAPSPPEVEPPMQWGDPTVVRERLGDSVVDLTFSRGRMAFPALSPAHYRAFMEQAGIGNLSRLLSRLDAEDPDRATQLRADLENLVAEYLQDNVLAQDYLLTRARRPG